MLGEMTDKANESKAFSVFAVRSLPITLFFKFELPSQISYRIGEIIGQPLGGLLSHPERHFSFFDTEFWRQNPFALPCLIASAFAVASVIMGYFNLNEVIFTSEFLAH